MNMNDGLLKGEKCNRNGCKGIIEEGEKDGCCSCHINPPCGYCTIQTEYCPVCGWSAEEEQREYEEREYEERQRQYYLENPPKPIVHKSDEQRFQELKDGEFGCIHVESGGHTIVRLRGKHPNMSAKEIYSKLNLYENPHMPRMKRFTNTTFELTYFCD